MAEYTFRDIIIDSNGPIPYTEDIAAIGFVSKDLYLQIPANMKIPTDFGIEVPMDEEIATDFLGTNFSALIKNGAMREAAAFGALLRYRMIREKLVASNLNNRAVFVDEYTYNVAKIEKIDSTSFTPTLVHFVATYFFAIVGVVAHVFRVRGHHFKEEYTELYERTWKACAIDIPSDVKFPTWEFISKNVLHCFGIRALAETVKLAFMKHELPAGLLKRIDAAPVSTAPVRTASAALREMSSASWWSVFFAKYREEIEAIHKEAQRLKEADLRAHMNAGLYENGVIRVIANEDVITPLAPYVLGWIDSLDRREAIKGQKCLDKRGSGGIDLRNAFSIVISAQNRADRMATTVVDFIKGVS